MPGEILDKRYIVLGQCCVFPMVGTTIQSMMNVKLSKQRFQNYYENGLIKTIQMIPYNLYVRVKLTSLYRGLRLILVYPDPQ